jgi:zinc protease
VKSGAQFDEAVSGLGMTIDSSIGETSGMLTFTALADRADPSLALVKEVLTQSEFRQEKLDEAKAQMRSAIAHRNDDLTAVAQRELRSLILGKDSPYGWQSNYTTIERITRTDLKNFYKRYFFPANVMLGIWGDFDSAQMKSKIEALFADWTVTQPPVPAFPEIKAGAAPGVYLAEKRDAPATFLAIGHLGGMSSQKDFPALEVMGLVFNQIQAHIARRIRENLGTADVRLMGVALDKVDAVWGAGFDHRGVFRISAATRGAGTVDAIQAIRSEIDRIRTEEISDDDLKMAKAAVIASIAATWDGRAKALGRLMSNQYYGFPPDFVQQYQAGVMAVTKMDVLRAAKEYLNPANLTMVVVGNPQVFADPLEKVNPLVNKIDLTIPEARPVTVESTDVSVAEARRLLQRAQEKAGGAARLRAVKDATTVAEYQLDPAIQNLGGTKILETDRWIAPEIFRQDLGLPTGKVSAFTDGKVGWISTPQGWGALVGTQLKQVQGDLFRWYFRLLLSDSIEGRTVNAVDQDLIEVADTTGQMARVEFDPKTGLPARVTYDQPQAAGAPIYSVDALDDYREVDGILFPFKVTIMRGGRKFADVTVTDCKLSSGLKDVDLAKRQ